MPGGYSIDVTRRLVVSAGWGVLTGSDFLRHARAVRDDPRFEPSFAQFVDLRAATGMAAQSPEIRELAAINPFALGARRAILVGSDVAFGMARMYQLLTDTSPDVSHVFRDEAEALAWLGVADRADELRRTVQAIIAK